jgi:GntR family transcriptional regulator / MocR family aminotransferase
MTLHGAMAAFIDDGLLARHVRKAARTYAARHAQILDTLHRDLAAELEPVPSSAGLHVCARVRPGADLDVSQLLVRVRSAGLALQSLGDYCTVEPQHGLVLGYGAIATDRIGAGMERLHEVIQTQRRYP